MRYQLMLENPIDFYNEAHRTIHFLDFATRAQDEQATATDFSQEAAAADREDYFA
jgi:hypothetical protein